MIHYPFRTVFELPRNLWFNGVVGLCVLAFAIKLALGFREQLRSRQPGALLFLGFGLLTLGSAGATAVGRASFDVFGVANANASRYTLFSSYLLFGIFYFVGMLIREHEAMNKARIENTRMPRQYSWPYLSSLQ